MVILPVIWKVVLILAIVWIGTTSISSLYDNEKKRDDQNWIGE